MWALGVATRLVFRSLGVATRLTWLMMLVLLNRRQTRVPRYRPFVDRSRRR